MSKNKFKTKKFSVNGDNVNKGSAKLEQVNPELNSLYEDQEQKDSSFKKPLTKSRLFVIALVVSCLFGLVAGFLGVIAFFSGTLSFLQIGPEELLPTECFVLQRNEEVTVLEDERNNHIFRESQDSVVAFFRKHENSEDLLENIYLAEDRLGLGFVLTNDGWIITSDKVFQEGKQYVAITSDKQILEVERQTKDNYSGLVFVKVKGDGLATLPLADPDLLRVGSRMFVGNYGFSEDPSGLVVRITDIDYQTNSTKEIVVKETDISEDLVVFDKSLPMNFLGSPVVNSSGEIIGLVINPEKGYLRSVADFRTIVSQLLSGAEKINRVDLGLKFVQLDRVLGSNVKVKKGERTEILENGALIVAISPDGVASNSKLKVGDVVVMVGEKTVSLKNSFSRLLQEYSLGDSAILTILRPGSDEELLVTVNF